MALTANQIRNTAVDSLLVEETLAVLMAMQARTVLSEGAVANHAERLIYAKTVLANPPQAAHSAKWLVLTEPTLSALTPAALGAAVVASWDLMSGV